METVGRPPTIVYTDNVGSGLFEEEPAEVDRYITVFGDVQAAALPASRSAEFIEDILKESES